MNGKLGVWFLGGVLLVSLAWNVRLASQEPPAPPVEVAGCCAGSGCELSVESLGLSPAQCEVVEDAGERCAAAVDDWDAQLEALLTDLREALVAEPLDRAEVQRLADEVSALRARVLQECLASFLQMREDLEGETVGQLWDQCVTPEGRE